MKESGIMIKPNKLKRGDKIAIVSLSRGLIGNPKVKHELDIAIKRLNNYGFEVEIMPNAMKSFEYLLKHPEARAQDLKDAFKDDSIKGIITAIGGFDTFRTYEYLMNDLEFINNVKNNPKVFMGFSDTTMNHLMFYRLGLTTFYGPAIVTDFAELDNEMLPYTKSYFELLLEDTENYEIKSSPVWYSDRESYDVDQIGTSRIIHDEVHGYEALNGGGISDGILYGGCIDSFYNAYTGARFNGDFDYEPEMVNKYNILPTDEEYKKMILFFETSQLRPTPEEFKEYLMEFKRRNILQLARGILFGKPINEQYYEEYKEVIKEVFKDIDTPVLYNLNFGHSYPRCIIPYGLHVTVDFDNKKIIVDEPIVNTLNYLNKKK